MFPWVYGFTWTTGNLTFLGIFFTVLAVIGGTLTVAVVRTVRGTKGERGNEVRWHSDFNDLPENVKICRHAMTGRLPGRICPNAFDCRVCDVHPRLAAEEAAVMRSDATIDPSGPRICGLSMPHDRLYHRGHAWLKREPDGTCTMGLDAYGQKLIGRPDLVRLPGIGSKLEVNGTAWQLEKRGVPVRILSPVRGRVIATGGCDKDFYLRVLPDEPVDLRHLLRGAEIRPWIMREIERLEMAFDGEKMGSSLADGGEMMNDLSSVYPAEDWDRLFGEIFLQA